MSLTQKLLYEQITLWTNIIPCFIRLVVDKILLKISSVLHIFTRKNLKIQNVQNTVACILQERVSKGNKFNLHHN